MFAWFKKIWSDPVWSKVISVALIAIAGALAAKWHEPIQKTWHDHPVAAPEIAGAFALLVVAFGTVLWGTRMRVKAEIKVEIPDQHQHAPWIVIAVHNRSWKRARIVAIEFITKNHWDIPDPRCSGTTVPVAGVLGRDSVVLGISPELNSVARLGLGEWVEGRKSAEFKFRLTTQHSPDYPHGVFPFHLGVQLVCGSGNSHVCLKDVVTSLHGQRAVSELVVGGYGNPLVSWGKLRQNAYQALGVIKEGAYASRETVEALRSFTDLEAGKKASVGHQKA